MKGMSAKPLMESGIDREEVFISTKVWNSDQGYHSTLKACEKSLRRLGLTYVDLILHPLASSREEQRYLEGYGSIIKGGQDSGYWSKQL